MIVDICKENAIRYSKMVSEKRCEESGGFPAYFDWSDHIAVFKAEEYQYHLNKTVLDIEKLVKIFRPHIQPKEFELWGKNWYEHTLCAGWIHDIGMIEGREYHSKKSAKLLFKNDDNRFDFSWIPLEDKIKIAILCIRHNKSWHMVVEYIREILRDYNISQEYIDDYFEGEEPKSWDLLFSGKLVATADFLRYRGKQLQNNLKKTLLCFSNVKNVAKYISLFL